MPATYSFPKTARLLKAIDFKKLFQAGKKLNVPQFGLYSKLNHQTQARLGIVLAKKAVRLASTRNQIKRIIRESFRAHQQLLAGHDVLIVGYPKIHLLDKAELRSLLDQQWKKSVLLSAKH